MGRTWRGPGELLEVQDTRQYAVHPQISASHPISGGVQLLMAPIMVHGWVHGWCQARAKRCIVELACNQRVCRDRRERLCNPLATTDPAPRSPWQMPHHTTELPWTLPG